jgi:multiple sugar transport system substrate-binding protein
VTGNPLLTPFVYEIQKMGQAYPPSSMPGKNVSAIQTAGGQAWSSVIGGQATPEAAASSFIDALTPLLTK